MQLVKFTHANFGTIMYIAQNKICGYYYAPANKVTAIVCEGSTVFPARESVEQVSELLNGTLTNDSKEGESNNVGTN